MVEVMLFIKIPGDQQWQGAGRRQFQFIPRPGEHVELTMDGSTFMYKVVSVHHPEEPFPELAAADVYALRDGTKVDVIMRY
jgi:hypothetical protein